MSQFSKEVGAIGWLDLTVPDASAVKDFYKAVVGWTDSEFPVSDYKDYCVHRPGDNEIIAGICHQKGGNEAIPSYWMPYVNVADLAASLKAVEAGNGKIIDGPKSMGSEGEYAFIQDPAGAYIALFEHSKAE